MKQSLNSDIVATFPEIGFRHPLTSYTSYVPDHAPIRASLVVLNFNGDAVIAACLDSLSRAMSSSDELIVVDNASSDGSLELLRAREDITLVELPRNTFIFGLNEGLARARGFYVAFLNNDMVEIGRAHV